MMQWPSALEIALLTNMVGSAEVAAEMISEAEKDAYMGDVHCAAAA